ncbi:MAG: hypothetical protein ABIO39_01490 [Caulobacteraceae bacterium]
MEVVNGFQCKNCTDVDYAKKHIDPAHPKDGPYGVNNPAKAEKPDAVRKPAFEFGGLLSGQDAGARPAGLPPPSASGSILNLTV